MHIERMKLIIELKNDYIYEYIKNFSHTRREIQNNLKKKISYIV